jgi:hypothetical protein
MLSGAKHLQYALEHNQMQILRSAQDDSQGAFSAACTAHPPTCPSADLPTCPSAGLPTFLLPIRQADLQAGCPLQVLEGFKALF